MGPLALSAGEFRELQTLLPVSVALEKKVKFVKTGTEPHLGVTANVTLDLGYKKLIRNILRELCLQKYTALNFMCKIYRHVL